MVLHEDSAATQSRIQVAPTTHEYQEKARLLPLLSFPEVRGALAECQMPATESVVISQMGLGKRNFGVALPDQALVDERSGLGWPRGTIAIVDPDQEPTNMQLGMFQLGNGYYVFRNMWEPGDSIMLVPLNKNEFETIFTKRENVRAVGKVVEFRKQEDAAAANRTVWS
jgi:hypothetical protein